MRMSIFLFKKFFVEEFWSIFKNVKKWIFYRICKKYFDQGRVLFLTKKYSVKAKHPRICPSLGDSMPEAQIKQCPLRPSPTRECFRKIIPSAFGINNLKYLVIFPSQLKLLLNTHQISKIVWKSGSVAVLAKFNKCNW